MKENLSISRFFPNLSKHKKNHGNNYGDQKKYHYGMKAIP